jgi:Domain of unknown function (DUF4124)
MNVSCARMLAVLFATGAIVPIAQAQIYKCTDQTGKTIYSDARCESGGPPLKLPNASTGPATDRNMCAQLLDETQRLAAEADRDAKSGRARNANKEKRRQSLTRQYEARCAGIARSEPKPK